MTREPSPLERDFLLYWRGLHPELPEPVHNYAKAIPNRKLEMDFAWPDAHVACEIQGGSWAKGEHQGHTRGSMYEKDCIKLNLAVAAGWRCFWLTTTMLKGDPGRWLDLIAEAVEVANANHRCESCKHLSTADAPVQYVRDPFIWEIDDECVMRWLCTVCEEERRDDI